MGQLESILRISESFAKMRLDPVVTKDDIEQALSLVKSSTHSAATDPKTGLVDIDLLITGRSAKDRENFEHHIDISKNIIEELKENNREKIKYLTFKNLLEEKLETNISNNELGEILHHLELEDDIQLEKSGNNPYISLN